MKKILRCLPIGDLPYETDKAATKMMVKLFEDVPYLPNFPNISPNETLIQRTLFNIPGIYLKDSKVIFDKEEKNLKQKLLSLDIAFNNPLLENLVQYEFDSYFLPKYLQIIDRIKPAHTVVNLLGPFSILQRQVGKEGLQLLADKYYRKVIIQTVAVRALWIINKIKELSPDTKIIILLDEPMLHKVGDVKRNNEDITTDMIIKMFSKVVDKIHEAGALVCIQCFEKCDWKIPIEAGVDIISFDAYNNPNNLNIIPEQVNSFLASGGRINWAIVPVKNETLVKSLTVDYVYDRLIKTMEDLIIAGTSERLIYNRALVSVQGNTNHLPLIFAEKALMLSIQVAKRMPFKG